MTGAVEPDYRPLDSDPAGISRGHLSVLMSRGALGATDLREMENTGLAIRDGSGNF